MAQTDRQLDLSFKCKVRPWAEETNKQTKSNWSHLNLRPITSMHGTVLNHKISTNELFSHSQLTNYPTELFTPPFDYTWQWHVLITIYFLSMLDLWLISICLATTMFHPWCLIRYGMKRTVHYLTRLLSKPWIFPRSTCSIPQKRKF